MAVIGSGRAFPQITITNSQTWTPPMSGNVCIHVVGAGGGACASTNYATGGGAGGYCKYNSLAVTPANNLTIVVGAGGRGGIGSANTGYPGLAGGNSTVSGTGLSSTLTANGGAGGPTGFSNGTGSGGTASGGNVNNQGGSCPSYQISQGGSVGIYGTGEDGSTGHGQANDYTVPDSAGGGLAMSQFGVIVGGTKVGNMRLTAGSGKEGFGFVGLDGGDLMGGGSNRTSDWHGAGGNGGIGGGGGGSNSYSGYGGRGGDGIVLIQYLPW